MPAQIQAGGTVTSSGTALQGALTGMPGVERPPDVDCATMTEVAVRYGPYVRAIACNSGLKEEARDVVQDVLLALGKSVRKTGQMPRSITSMLCVITCRKVRDRIRRRVARARASEAYASELPRSQRDPEQALIGAEISLIVREILDALPEMQRLALIQIEMNGMTSEEVAEGLDCPASTVRWHLQEARKQFIVMARRRGLGLGES